MIEDKQCLNCQRKYGYWKWSLWPRRKPFPCKSCGYSIRFDVGHNSVFGGIIAGLFTGIFTYVWKLNGWSMWGAFCLASLAYILLFTVFLVKAWKAGELILVDEAGLPLDPNHEIKSV